MICRDRFEQVSVLANLDLDKPRDPSTGSWEDDGQDSMGAGAEEESLGISAAAFCCWAFCGLKSRGKLRALLLCVRLALTWELSFSLAGVCWAVSQGQGRTRAMAAAGAWQA